MITPAEGMTMAPASTASAPSQRRRQGRRLFARRAGWGLADQAVSSLTNFSVGIIAARSLTVTEFGAFSLAFVTFASVVNLSRGMSTEPLLVRHSGEQSRQWRGAASQATGSALAVGLLLCPVVVGVGLAIPGVLGRALLALGVSLPGLTLQDSWRYAFFSIGRGASALVNDSVWAGCLVITLLGVHRYSHVSASTCMLAWGMSASVAAVVGHFQSGVIPRPLRVVAWCRRHRDLCLRYAIENVSLGGASQLRYYGLGALAGLAAVAQTRAGEMLLAPFFVVIMGMGLIAIPEAVRVLRGGTSRLRRFCLALGGCEALAALTWGLVVLAVLSWRGTGQSILGPVWISARPLLVPATVAITFSCLTTGASIGLHALGAARRSVFAQLVWSVAYLVGGVSGAAIDSARGSAWGVAFGCSVGAVAFWWQLSRGVADAERAPAPSPSRCRSGRHREPSGGPTVSASGSGRHRQPRLAVAVAGQPGHEAPGSGEL